MLTFLHVLQGDRSVCNAECMLFVLKLLLPMTAVGGAAE
jgi:hypothetical protein